MSARGLQRYLLLAVEPCGSSWLQQIGLEPPFRFVSAPVHRCDSLPNRTSRGDWNSGEAAIPGDGQRHPSGTCEFHLLEAC